MNLEVFCYSKTTVYGPFCQEWSMAKSTKLSVSVSFIWLISDRKSSYVMRWKEEEENEMRSPTMTVL